MRPPTSDSVTSGVAPDPWGTFGGRRRGLHLAAAEPPVPPFVMDRPILHAFVRELLEHDRLQAFADALPDARARVSEPALPLVVAALHELLDRGLVVLCAEDADARDVAEAAGWFIGDER